MADLSGITFIHAKWLDRHNNELITHNRSFTIDGSQTITTSIKRSGLPVKVDCAWVNESTIEQLKALPDEPMQLTLSNDTVLNVMFDRAGQAFETTEIIDYADDTGQSLFALILNLITV